MLKSDASDGNPGEEGPGTSDEGEGAVSPPNKDIIYIIDIVTMAH